MITRSIVVGLLVFTLLVACSPASPTPTPAPGPTDEEIAREHIEEFIRLGEQDVPLERAPIADFLAQIEAVLAALDADHDILAGLHHVLEAVLGSALSSPPETTAALAGVIRLASFSSQTQEPQENRFSGSAAWEMLKEFVRTIVYTIAPSGTAVQAANPEVARGILKSYTRAGVLDHCFGANLDSCLGGNDPAYNRMADGDLPGAFRTLHPEPEPGPTLVPTSVAPTPTRPPGTATAAPTPTRTVLMPTVTSVAPTPSPTATRPAPTLTPTLTPTRPAPTLAPTLAPTPTSDAGLASASMTALQCNEPEQIAGGTILIYNSVVATGTASGPTGTVLGGTIDSCTSWPGCERVPGSPASTTWHYSQPGGAIAGNTLTFYVLTTSPAGIKNFSFTSQC